MVTEAPAWEPDGRALPRILSGIRGSCTTCYIYTNLDESLPEKGTQIYDVFVNVYIAPWDTDDCSVRSGPFLVTSIHISLLHERTPAQANAGNRKEAVPRAWTKVTGRENLDLAIAPEPEDSEAALKLKA